MVWMDAVLRIFWLSVPSSKKPLGSLSPSYQFGFRPRQTLRQGLFQTPGKFNILAREFVAVFKFR